MKTDPNPPTNLANKPLVEAWFELRWGLEAQAGQVVDPHHQILVGQLYSLLKEKYPFSERLPTADIPEGFAPYLPRHRFRVASERWPLVQISPGILTVNDTENYTWEDFSSYCTVAIDALFSIHPNANNLRITEVALHYADADILQDGSALELLQELKVSVKLPEALFAGQRISPVNSGVNLSLTYPAKQPKGTFQVSFRQGRKNEDDALIWETQVLSRGADAPHLSEEIKTWLQDAHDTTHDWFFRQIDGDLLERYK